MCDGHLQTDVSLLQLPGVGDPGPAGVGPPVPLPHRLDDQSVRLYDVAVSWNDENNIIITPRLDSGYRPDIKSPSISV